MKMLNGCARRMPIVSGSWAKAWYISVARWSSTGSMWRMISRRRRSWSCSTSSTSIMCCWAWWPFSRVWLWRDGSYSCTTTWTAIIIGSQLCSSASWWFLDLSSLCNLCWRRSWTPLLRIRPKRMLMRLKRANNSKNSKIWSNCSCLVHVKAAWAISSLEPSTKVQLENNKTRIKNCKLMTLIRKRQILRIMLRFKKVWAISVMRNATLITRLPRRRKTRKTPVSTSVSRT